MEFGPMQILVVAFKDADFTGEILAELRRLREHDIVRLVDALVVARDDAGELSTLEITGLTKDEWGDLGSIVGGLIGFGPEGEEEAEEAGVIVHAEGLFTDEDRWVVTDAIPAGSAAAVVLLEHRWAIPLRAAIGNAGGVTVTDSWVHPEDLVALGTRPA